MVDITNNWSPVHTYPYSLENATFFLRFLKKSGPLVAFSSVHTYTHSRPQCLLVWDARFNSEKLCAGVAKIWFFGPHSACSFIPKKTFFFFYIYFIAKVLCCFGIRTEEINGVLEEFSGIQGSCGSCWENTVKSSQIWDLKFAYAWQLIKYLRQVLHEAVSETRMVVKINIWKFQ